MEQQSKSFLPKLMSILFIAMGVFLGFYAFFANATSWTLNGGSDWDNANYLDPVFWSDTVSDYDIVTALYGTGDAGSAYTQHWTGYNSGTCLSGVMNVVYTGVIPNPIVANTIYVLDAGTYDLTSPITLQNCTALTSTGIVILSGNMTNPSLIKSTSKNNIIIEKIRTNGNNTGHNGLVLTGTTNVTIKDFQSYGNISGGNDVYGAVLLYSSYIDIINSQFHNNSNGVAGVDLSNVFMNNVQAYQNNIYGIAFNNINNSTLSGINSNNNVHGLLLSVGSNNTLTNIDILSNLGHGLRLQSINNSSFSTIHSYVNEDRNVYLDSSANNTLTNIVADTSASAMGVYLGNSSGNTLSGVSAYGNYYAGVHFYNSNNNTGINIISNSNSGGLYMENSSGNNFSNFAISNSMDNGVVFSGSHYNSLSGLVASGNMWHGVYYANSNNNTIKYSTIHYNHIVGMLIETGINNSITYSTINNNGIGGNGNGMLLSNCSGTIIDQSNLSFNINQGITLDSSNNNQITNFTINNNDTRGILFGTSSNNIISGGIVSGNLAEGIYLNTNSNNNTITNVTNLHSYPLSVGTRINDSTGNSINKYSGNNVIFEYSNLGAFQYTTYDTYTQTNNNIILNSINYSANLTGNTLSIGSIFYTSFDQLILGDDFIGNNFITFSGVASFTISANIWDGSLYFPNQITTGTKLCMTGESGTTNIAKIFDTIEVVSGSTYLTMNGGTGTINFIVGSGTSGQYLKIFKSIDGTTWTSNTLTSGCILDSQKKCVFTTNGTLKLFAFGVPTNYSFTGVTQAGSGITTGGYYKTGVIIYFTGDNLSGATLSGIAYNSGNLITGDGYYTFILTDLGGNSTGISFTIDKTIPSVTAIYPTSGLNYTGGINGNNNISFLRTGLDTNMSGYTLYVNGNTYTTTATGYTYNSMSNGSYSWYVVATDRAGNTGVSQTFPFVLSTPLSGTATVTGTNLQYIMGTLYTKQYVGLSLRANQQCNYVITGNIDRFSALYTGTLTVTRALTGADGPKTIYIYFTNASGEVVTGTIPAYLDTMAPIPTLTSPASGATVTGTFSLVWPAVGADAVGLSGYQYFVSTTGTLGTGVVLSGFTIALSTGITNGLLSSGTYYWYVKAIDKLGNIGTSAVQPFYFSGVADTIPDQFTFNTVTSATLDHIYGSNTITIAGLSANTPVLASITKGVLYISGVMVGTTGYVQNGWTVKIEMNSSDQYNTLVTSTLSIGGVYANFRVTTETETEANNGTNYNDISTNLSSTEKLQIIAIFEALSDLYAGDKEAEFFSSLMVMLQSKMDDLGTSTDDVNKHEALQYLYDLAEQYGNGSGGTDNTDIGNTSRIVNGVYKAPNGKPYTIRYDSVKKQFTSVNFLTPKFFATLDMMKYIIDLYNAKGSQYASAKPIKARWGVIPMEGQRTTSPYTAPNRKVFYFFKTTEGQFSSYTFTVEKYFDSLEATKEYIHNSNLR